MAVMQEKRKYVLCYSEIIPDGIVKFSACAESEIKFAHSASA